MWGLSVSWLFLERKITAQSGTRMPTHWHVDSAVSCPVMGRPVTGASAVCVAGCVAVCVAVFVAVSRCCSMLQCVL